MRQVHGAQDLFLTTIPRKKYKMAYGAANFAGKKNVFS